MQAKKLSQNGDTNSAGNRYIIFGPLGCRLERAKEDQVKGGVQGGGERSLTKNIRRQEKQEKRTNDREPRHRQHNGPHISAKAADRE